MKVTATGSIHLWRGEADSSSHESDGYKVDPFEAKGGWFSFPWMWRLRGQSVWAEPKPTFLPREVTAKGSIHLRQREADFPSPGGEGPMSISFWGVGRPSFLRREARVKDTQSRLSIRKVKSWWCISPMLASPLYTLTQSTQSDMYVRPR